MLPRLPIDGPHRRTRPSGPYMLKVGGPNLLLIVAAVAAAVGGCVVWVVR